MEAISIVVPAFKAADTICRAVQSVLRQTHTAWELIVVSDDDLDYESVLKETGIVDSRISFASTGQVGSGSPVPRNIGLDLAQYDFIAILDADDYMHPRKLELAAKQLQSHTVVSCALQITNSDEQCLRFVGRGPNRILKSGEYKFTMFSSDSMLVYDRRVADPRFDTDLPCVTDVDFLLKLFAKSDYVFHLGAPLHYYVKRTESVTNAPGGSERITATKEMMIKRLLSGHYLFKHEPDRDEVIRFFHCALKAEEHYRDAAAQDGVTLYEDCIQRVVQADALARIRILKPTLAY